MIHNNIWLLAARKLTGNASAKDKSDLDELLHSDPLLKEKLNAIEEFFYEVDKKCKEEETNIAFKRLWKKIEHQ